MIIYIIKYYMILNIIVARFSLRVNIFKVTDIQHRKLLLLFNIIYFIIFNNIYKLD